MHVFIIIYEYYKIPIIINTIIYSYDNDTQSNINNKTLRTIQNLKINDKLIEISQITITEDKSIFSIFSGINSFSINTCITYDTYIINTCVMCYKLSNDIMDIRKPHNNIGFFYNSIKCDINSKQVTLCDNNLLECKNMCINRMNLNKAPWKFYVDPSFPKEYHSSIIDGILSWNRYFKYLNLGEPFQACVQHKTNEMNDSNAMNDSNFNVCDMKNWKIVNNSGKITSVIGTSYVCIDYRSGENMFGNINININKIKQYSSQYYLSTNNVFNTNKFIEWVVSHEVGHQLGLRHNFLGYFDKTHFTSIMGYYDLLFMDIPDNTHIFKYDLNTIEYGYCNLKEDELKTLANSYNHYFGTDINLKENNPFVSTFINEYDIFKHISNAIKELKKYRINILNHATNNTLSCKEYTNMFFFIYNKYKNLFEIYIFH